MAKKIDQETRQALADRVQYYREIGIHDFYRRDVPENVSAIDKAQTLAAEEGAALESAPASAPDVDHAEALRLIREDLGDCTRCKLHTLGRKQIVFGVGNPNAELMFVGEGPGADEDAQGIPFVGRAGQLLTNMIAAMGLSRDDVYIANVVKCRPPQNRTPEPDECATCSPFLMRQIDTIQPKVIVALGAVSAKNLLQVNAPIGQLRGKWYDFRGTRLMVTFHPAYLLRDPSKKREAWHDLQQVMAQLGLEGPKKSQ
jgi:DNA polymerase